MNANCIEATSKVCVTESVGIPRWHGRHQFVRTIILNIGLHFFLCNKSKELQCSVLTYSCTTMCAVPPLNDVNEQIALC